MTFGRARLARTLGCLASTGFGLALVGYPAPVSAASAVPAAWPEQTIVKTVAGLADAVMAPGRNALVGEVAATGLDAFSRLEWIDLANGVQHRGSLVFNGGSLVTVGSTIGYVEPRTQSIEPNGEAAPTSSPALEEIRSLRSGTATVGAAVYLPLTTSDSMAESSSPGHEVWAGEQGRVVLLSTASGRVLRSITLPEMEGQFGVSVNGSTLYTIANAVGSRPIEVYEVSLQSGTIVASKGILGVGGDVTAVRGGVWVAYRTGMLGTAQLLSSGNLAVVASRPATGPVPVPGSSEAMGISVIVTGGTAWLTDLTAIVCANASTGQVLGTASLPSGVGEFWVAGAIGRSLYAAETRGSGPGPALVKVATPTACWQ